jgi:hypothetical protein
MQTFSEFRAHWQPLILKQAGDVAERIEAGHDMSRFPSLEPQHRADVDKLVREYSSSLSVARENLTLELGYLFHLRLQQAAELAQFLDHCGLGETVMDAQDWIQFLAIDAWHEFTVHKWRHEFERVYPGND